MISDTSIIPYNEDDPVLILQDILVFSRLKRSKSIHHVLKRDTSNPEIYEDFEFFKQCNICDKDLTISQFNKTPTCSKLCFCKLVAYCGYGFNPICYQCGSNIHNDIFFESEYPFTLTCSIECKHIINIKIPSETGVKVCYICNNNIINHTWIDTNTCSRKCFDEITNDKHLNRPDEWFLIWQEGPRLDWNFPLLQIQ